MAGKRQKKLSKSIWQLIRGGDARFEILRAARAMRGYSQGELAAMYGCSRQQFSRWECGAAAISYDDLKGVVEGVCGVSLQKLIGASHENH